MKISHPIPPIFDKNSKILILGSFPSVKSREEMFFYGHPQNRFWRVLAEIYESEIPTSIEKKTNFLLKNNIALWDVIGECEIVGSSDSTIKNAVPNNIDIILRQSDINQIFVNGKTAEKYYKKFLAASTGREAICLPSTSPANAAWSFGRLVAAWQIIK